MSSQNRILIWMMRAISLAKLANNTFSDTILDSCAASVTVENISYEIDGCALFKSVTHEFKQGECWQILGSNGVGKSTILRIIAGLLLPSQGKIDLSTNLLVQQPAYVGHAPHCKNELSVIDNLRWLLALYPSASRSDEDIYRALQYWNILQYQNHSFRTLSAGQKKRVMLSWLLLRNASMWLLDEPFSALDQSAITRLWQEIHVFVENGGIVLFASHQVWDQVSFRQTLALEPFSQAPATQETGL